MIDRRGRHVPLSVIATAGLLVVGLASCAGWEVRPESAVVEASADETWRAALEILRQAEFKISQQDNVKRELQASRDVILRAVSERGTGKRADKEKHQIDLTVRSQGDNRSVVEVVYRLEKLVDDDSAFRF
ncbi:MAG: hypothetical protein ACREJ4_17235, partial [Candidatus Methylomirabilaceae bacterium]